MSESAQSGTPEVSDSDTETPKVKPLDVDGVGAVLVGTIAWAVTFVVLLFFRQSLEDSGSAWWLWVAAVGFGFGLMGLLYTTRRRAVYRRAHEDEGQS